jgi:alpha-mannosidase
VRAARNFNLPIQPCLVPRAAPLADEGQFAASHLDLGDTTFVLSAFKQTEGDPNQYILRGYESAGAESTITIGGVLPVAALGPVNLLEQPQPIDDWTAIAPWQVLSLAISPSQPEL